MINLKKSFKMSLDWDNIDSSAKLINAYFFYPFYQKLNDISKKHPSIRFTAPLVGITDTFATLTLAITNIGECLIKGIGNLFQSILFQDRRSLKLGSLQLIGLGVISYSSVFIVAFRIVRITIKMLIDPEQTSQQQAENYRKNLETSPNATA